MKHYVLCLIQAKDTGRIIFVRKNRPEWQKGRVNLIGGKVEINESIEKAAIREIYEEVGIKFDLCNKRLGKIVDIDEYNAPYEVHCFKFYTEKELVLTPSSIDEDEEFFWQLWKYTRHYPNLIQNLKTIIPLMFADQENWTIHTTSYEPYTVEVTYNEGK